ncbi:MAG: TolC family protein [Bryobacteraceae bacterium]|nr:TolC family protein [Bryobacteraceae bacterium]
MLTLEDAVNLALAHNRSIEQASLSAAGTADAIAAARTQRLPQFSFSSTTGLLLTRPTITFEKGAFGEYPGIGSVPGDTTEISSARKPTAILTAEVALPLTQQFRIGLGIRSLKLSEKIARQQVRLTRQEVVKQVRQVYYSILQKQSSLDAVEQTIQLLREVSRQTSHYVRVGTALDADLLDVQARLAKAEYDKIALTSPIATQKEQLNQLLGRPIECDFRVAQVIESSWITELADARERAVASRPEIEQARLKIDQAVIERRKKKSEYIPDVSLAVTYYSAINVSSSLPRNVAIAGVQTNWQPFDWGKKRNELAQKDKAIQEAAIALRDLEDKVRIEVGSAFRKMQEARMMLAASRASQESTREAARVASVRFRSNSALLKDVLEAQTELASASDNTQQAILAYWSARADFEKAVGEEQ